MSTSADWTINSIFKDEFLDMKFYYTSLQTVIYDTLLLELIL